MKLIAPFAVTTERMDAPRLAPGRCRRPVPSAPAINALDELQQVLAAILVIHRPANRIKCADACCGALPQATVRAGERALDHPPGASQHAGHRHVLAQATHQSPLVSGLRNRSFKRTFSHKRQLQSRTAPRAGVARVCCAHPYSLGFVSPPTAFRLRPASAPPDARCRPY
jgi:hypothetical protein